MEKKYNLQLTQDEMDAIVFALVTLKVDIINCLECNVNVEFRNRQLGTVCSLLAMCAEKEALNYVQ